MRIKLSEENINDKRFRFFLKINLNEIRQLFQNKALRLPYFELYGRDYIKQQ